MADSVDWGAVESQLKQKAGSNYDPSMLGDVQRNSSYGAGDSPDQASVDDWVNRVSNKAQLRSSNESNSTYVANGQGGYTVGPTGNINNPNGGPTGSGQGGGNSNDPPSWWTDYQNQQKSQQDQWNQRADSLYNTLLGRAQQSLTINASDPVIKGQVDAYRAEQDRGARNSQTQWAEQSGPYANPQGQERMLAEKSAQATSGLQASLIGNELTSRRNEIQNSLTQMGGLLSDEQRTNLQQQLGLIDANLRQQGINSGNDQFSATLGLNTQNQANYWDAIRSGLL